MINAKQARANVNTELDFLVQKCLEVISREIENAQTYVVSVKTPTNQSVMLRVVKELENLGYEVTQEKYSAPREGWNNLIIKF